MLVPMLGTAVIHQNDVRIAHVQQVKLHNLVRAVDLAIDNFRRIGSSSRYFPAKRL